MIRYFARAWRKLRPSVIPQSIVSQPEVIVSEYKPLEFPKAKYHALLPPALVNNREEELALGEEWHDHPDFVEVVKPKLVIHEVKKPKP